MVRKIFGFLVLVVFLSGCATARQSEKKDAEILSLKMKISDMERALAEEQAKNGALRDRLVEKERIVQEVRLNQVQGSYKMPTAKEIQKALKAAGFYDGKVDGKIGSTTRNAIKKFQQANGLEADGVVGSRTWESMRKYLHCESNN